MRLLTHEAFTIPDDVDTLEKHPLVIHRLSSTTRPRGLILLVHGLRGRRYSYWGEMPALLLRDFPEYDVGLYYYVTGVRRAWKSDSIALPEEAELLASEMNRLPTYDHVAIVAHSMGGILSRGAIVNLFDNGRKATLRRIDGVVLAASPTLGSLRVPWLLKLISKDARALYPHNPYLNRLSRVLTSNFDFIYREPKLAKSSRSIPFWVLRAASDRWVDAMSSAAAFPDSQRHTVRGGHGDCINPSDGNHEGYLYIKECLQKSFGIGSWLQQDDNEVLCDKARESDAEAIHELAEGYFGDGVTPAADLMELIREGHFMNVVREIEHDGNAKRETIAGYFCVFPLNAAAREALVAGRLSGGEISTGHVASSAEHVACVYIGAVVGRGHYPSGMILGELKAFLYSKSFPAGMEFITRPVSKDGIRLARKYGFKEKYQHSAGTVLWATTSLRID
jgi:pimeloyl-ACP methyl ester carboxylesterase